MDYLDTDRFKSHHMMRAELELPESTTLSEAELVHLYDITFLVGRYDFVLESRRYMPNGTRVRTVN